jgi:hypothetical protein
MSKALKTVQKFGFKTKDFGMEYAMREAAKTAAGPQSMGMER